MTTAPDVTIIGAGAVGIASALSALEYGQTVEIIDRDPPASGASHGNAGVISTWSCVPVSLPGLWKSVPRWLTDPEGPLVVRPGHFLRFLPWAMKFLRAGRADRLDAIADAMMALSNPSLELYRRNLDGTGAEHLVRDSVYVQVFRGGRPDMSAPWVTLRQARGVPMRVVEGPELFEIEPALTRDCTSALILENQGRATDPGAVGRALAAKAEGMGAVIHRKTVDEMRPTADGGWLLRTDRGEHAARLIVLAAGAWSARLLAPLGIHVPLEAERGYHMVMQNPGVELNNSVMDVTGKFVASSMDAGVRLAGTAEFAGLDAPPDYRRAEVFKTHARRLFPDINTDQTEVWMGTRPSFPDSLPCIGPVPGQRNLFAAFGHSHFGFGMAPATGRIVGGLVSGQRPNVDLAPYAMERFF